MTKPLTVEFEFHVKRQGSGAAKSMQAGQSEAALPTTGRTPRVSRLMALAIRFDQLVREGAVADYAELARLSHVTRARITQIMNLLMLAPDIQEQILYLPRVERGPDSIVLRQMQPIALVPDWRKQRRFWRELLAQTSINEPVQEA